MSGTSSFDIGSYFNTLAIDEKLSRIIEYNETNSPSQLEYNRTCREVFEGLESLIRETSHLKIIKDINYFPGLPDTALDESGRIKSSAQTLCQNMPPAAIFIYLYMKDTDLLEAPFSLLMMRDVFLSQINEDSSFDEGAKWLREYENFSAKCRKNLADHVGEHLTNSGSNSVTSDEEFDEPLTIGLTIGSNEIKFEFTHPIQVAPLIDLVGLSLASTVSPAAKVAQLPENYNIHKLSGLNLKGDPTDKVIEGILRKIAPAIYLPCSNIEESSHDNTIKYTREGAVDNKVPFGASSLIDQAIDKAVSWGICQASSIDNDRCRLDGRKVSLYNKVGMLVCYIEI